MELRPNKKPRRVKTKAAISRKNQAEAQARVQMNSGVLALLVYLLTSVILAWEISGTKENRSCILLDISLSQTVTDQRIFEGLFYSLRFADFLFFLLSASHCLAGPVCDYPLPSIWLYFLKILWNTPNHKRWVYHKTRAFRLNDGECRDNKTTQISYKQRCFALSGNEQNKDSVILLVIHSHLLTNLSLSDLKKEREEKKSRWEAKLLDPGPYSVC